MLDLLSPHISIEDEAYERAVLIQEYAVGIRYPNPFDDPTKAKVLEALAAAEFFRNFAKDVLGI